MSIRERLGTLVRRHPRISAAVAFGGVAAALTHLAWIPEARMRGAAPVLTLGAGAAHAVAGAIMGHRLVDSTRTRTAAQACALGAITSLLAVAIFAPPFAAWVSGSNARSEGVLSYLALTALVGLSSFLAAGWPLLIASVGVGWGLYQLADRGGAT